MLILPFWSQKSKRVSLIIPILKCEDAFSIHINTTLIKTRRAWWIKHIWREKKTDTHRHHHSAQHADGGNDNLLQNSCLQPRSGRVFAEHPQVLIFIITLNWHDVATRVQTASVERPVLFQSLYYYDMAVMFIKVSHSIFIRMNLILQKNQTPASDHKGAPKSVLIIRNAVSIEDVNCTDGRLCRELPLHFMQG